jgi:hypothetical protein
MLVEIAENGFLFSKRIENEGYWFCWQCYQQLMVNIGANLPYVAKIRKERRKNI